MIASKENALAFLKDKEIDENKYLEQQKYIGGSLTDFGRLCECKHK